MPRQRQSPCQTPRPKTGKGPSARGMALKSPERECLRALMERRNEDLIVSFTSHLYLKIQKELICNTLQTNKIEKNKFVQTKGRTPEWTKKKYHMQQRVVLQGQTPMSKAKRLAMKIRDGLLNEIIPIVRENRRETERRNLNRQNAKYAHSDTAWNQHAQTRKIKPRIRTFWVTTWNQHA